MLDHLVYAVPDLDRGVADIAKRLGVEPMAGGHHPDWGTANALVGLGGQRYLEIIGPDAGATHRGSRPRPFGIDDLDAPRLVTWAAHVTDLDARVQAARAAGYNPGDIVDMSRTHPTGERLAWRLTASASDAGLPGNGVIPFLIEWGTSAHPTESLSPACTLVNLSATHPHPHHVRAALEALGVALVVEEDDVASLRAELTTPAGIVLLS